MIHFSIQHHGDNWEHLYWLAKSLASAQGSIDVALDGSGELATQLGARLAGPSVTVRQSLPVVWAGPSVVMQMREAMAHSVGVPGWEWFINLSGSCIPLVDPYQMAQRLRALQSRTGKHSFVFSFQVKRAPVWVPYAGPGSGKVAKLFRVPYVGDLAVERLVEAGRFNPVAEIEMRRSLWCAELATATGKQLLLRGLMPPELQDRQAFWRQYPYTLGRQWVVLHRKVVEWLVSSPQVSQVATLLGQTFLPDETFFQTCLASAPPDLKEGIDMKNNLRTKMGTPGRITAESLAHLAIGDALFSRKASGPLPALHRAAETLWQRP
ncbi:beta-1,6-N-acetylglucosaminyltransferase [Ideonella livida]|uniref:Peptide O-xylosyltransferase n=1 Tax=Ideonella livida TaxID=2707176 RepID=A0A7C9PHB6_9BURK|nr:beta-1,6-N-acetylglucosaminyltransferase [Ideonella livida]NDY91936.1 beta-1,6-N-acetylglucosaminyltransferase [Ideonella livida]